MSRMGTGFTLPRPPLLEVAMGYGEMEDFIWPELFTEVVTDTRASEFLAWDASKGMSIPDIARGVNGEFPMLPKDLLKNLAYSCPVEGLGRLIDMFESAELGEVFNIDTTAESAAVLYQTIMRVKELQAAGLIFNPALWTNAAGPKINRVPSADLEGFVATMHEDVHNQCGAAMNTLVLSYRTYIRLGTNLQLRERGLVPALSTHEYATEAKGRVIVDLPALEKFFQVKRIHVGRARMNTKPIGVSAVMADIWDDDFIWAGVVNPDSTLSGALQAIAKFVWGPFSGPGGEPYINPPFQKSNTTELMEAFTCTQFQQVNALCGKLYTGIDAP